MLVNKENKQTNFDNEMNFYYVDSAFDTLLQSWL